jgi:hypothetical protein
MHKIRFALQVNIAQKGERLMTYNKPELVQLNSAIHVVLSGIQKGSTHHDNVQGGNCSSATATAYEADE